LTESADGKTITGTLSQGISQPLILKKTDRVGELNRPQEPKKPFPYAEEEVQYANAAAGIRLAGTLTRPSGQPPYPAAILISGSGAQDRDETILGHKPFLVLSDHLTRKGIAVLRADDRGVGGSTGSFATSTTSDFASDVLAGIQFLKGRKEIDARHIGLIGHSEGGAIAPIVAAQSADVALVVLLAASGLPGEDILYAQAAFIAKTSGASDALITAQQAAQQSYYAVLKSGEDAQTQRQKLRALGNPDPAAIMSPWFRYFLASDPRPVIAKVKCPVLALIGSKDLQVSPRENLTAIASALKSGGNNDYKVVEIPNLNHLIQTSSTSLPGEYGTIEETMSPEVLELISKWIIQHQ
jgi:pimeloyl-ACP methyl ester carboxylesterase